jgi:hypothetical protein
MARAGEEEVVFLMASWDILDDRDGSKRPHQILALAPLVGPLEMSQKLLLI